jgi:hypothetical protein
MEDPQASLGSESRGGEESLLCQSIERVIAVGALPGSQGNESVLAPVLQALHKQ